MENSKKIILFSILLSAFIFHLLYGSNFYKPETFSTGHNDYFIINRNKTKDSDELLNQHTSIGHKQDTVKCKNDPAVYTEVVAGLLYKDNNSDIFLKRQREIIKSPFGGELSKCQKFPFSFNKSVGTLNDSIAFLKDVVDIGSFSKLEHSDVYFYDKNYMYVYRDYPVCYPPFYQIEINKKYARIFDTDYIKDLNKVYWKGLEIENADANSFTTKIVADKEGKPFTIVHDNKQIYFFAEPMNLERFNNLPLPKKTLDAVRKTFYK
ncbi:DKNYY domain-containing protein [Cellulophaga baltica]|uniref:DKNYY domain-containing protein n=1 Tax=Cellulophaga baltica TaxID=76594 RepID=UPI0021495FB9|nr:DKNYY domain-containing protein [Cellulophaga baltica]MCR1025062.1 DKNYY domain-containing protein [Cellulophaga baltica]